MANEHRRPDAGERPRRRRVAAARESALAASVETAGPPAEESLDALSGTRRVYPASGPDVQAPASPQPARFLRVRVKNHLIFHGFDADNHEIVDTFVQDEPMTKLIALDRIQSISERYILTSYAQDRLIFWEYDEEFESLEMRLAAQGLVIG